MKFKKTHYIGLAFAVSATILAQIFIAGQLAMLVSGIGILIGLIPIISSLMAESRINVEKEEMFLEFARNLVESVKTGTPISKSIINMKNKPYGVLSQHINKLANQIALGIPLNKALQTFSKDVRNKAISRSLTLIGQAERAGGDIGEILEAVAGAVNISDKLKKERKAAISNLVVQGYIIFLVFIIITLVMQFQIVPMVSGIGDISSMGLGGAGFGYGAGGVESVGQEQISNAFLYLILVESFFTGLVIGKLAEGDIKAGIKHSFALMFLSFMISAGANVLFSAA
jgi:flagellar protein FlaJ